MSIRAAVRQEEGRFSELFVLGMIAETKGRTLEEYEAGWKRK
jgi:hypothetical protein